MIQLLTCLILLFGYDRSDWISQNSWKKTRTRVLERDRIGNYWICKYSGLKIKNKSEVDIDHIVPLSYADSHCGDTFPESKKRQFATDTLNLVSTSRKQNRSKGDDGILEYMPHDNQCWYIERWYLVTKKYGICLTPEERGYISLGRNACNRK